MTKSLKDMVQTFKDLDPQVKANIASLLKLSLVFSAILIILPKLIAATKVLIGLLLAGSFSNPVTAGLTLILASLGMILAMILKIQSAAKEGIELELKVKEEAQKKGLAAREAGLKQRIRWDWEAAQEKGRPERERRAALEKKFGLGKAGEVKQAPVSTYDWRKASKQLTGAMTDAQESFVRERFGTTAGEHFKIGVEGKENYEQLRSIREELKKAHDKGELTDYTYAKLSKEAEGAFFAKAEGLKYRATMLKGPLGEGVPAAAPTAGTWKGLIDVWRDAQSAALKKDPQLDELKKHTEYLKYIKENLAGGGAVGGG